jgi:hypothetical protein
MLTPPGPQQAGSARQCLDFVQAGINFITENNPEATGYCMAAIPDCGRTGPVLIIRGLFVCCATGRRPLRISRCRYFQAEGLRSFREHRGAVTVLLKKAALFWGRAEVAHNKVESMDRRASVCWLVPAAFLFSFAWGTGCGRGLALAGQSRTAPQT